MWEYLFGAVGVIATTITILKWIGPFIRKQLQNRPRDKFIIADLHSGVSVCSLVALTKGGLNKKVEKFSRTHEIIKITIKQINLFSYRATVTAKNLTND